MKKFSKYFLLFFCTVLSLSLASCGGDDEPENPEKPDISTAGKLNTVTVSLKNNDYPEDITVNSEDVTVDVGCLVNIYYNVYYDYTVWCKGGSIAYAGDFNDLSSITTAPQKITSDTAIFHDGGCYVVLSGTGKYIRMKINREGSDKFVFKFQTYVPTNI